MKRMMSLLVIGMLLTSCGRKDESSGVRAGQGTGGFSNFNGTTIAGTVRILSDCQSSYAHVAIGPVGATTSSSYMQVQNGGTFEFNVNSGNYDLYAQAGNCSVRGTVQPLSSGSSPYSICLGSGCSSGNYKLSAVSASDVTPFMKSTPESGPYCIWNVYGCHGQVYPGSATVIVAPAKIFFNAKVDTDVNLSIEFAKGSQLFAASPALGAGWRLRAKTDGTVIENKLSYEQLSYDLLIDDKTMQFTDGFCGERDTLVGRMADYLHVSGFTAKAVQAFRQTWDKHLPVNPTQCVYPQGEEQIQKNANYKPSVAIEARRLWFIIVPQLEPQVSRIRPLPYGLASYGRKPKTDAFKEARKSPKTRSVASDAGLVAEEWGVGFLIER